MPTLTTDQGGAKMLTWCRVLNYTARRRQALFKLLLIRFKILNVSNVLYYGVLNTYEFYCFLHFPIHL